jgi:RNA polymerase subunit RPABC4/transcription elongation factor Spt4
MRGKRKRDDDEPKAKQCKKCYAIFAAALRACPQCSAEVEGKPREIEQVSGELVQVTKKQAQVDLRAEVSRARTYEQLAEIARKRGYKPGWARVMFEMRNKKRI